MNKLNGIVVIGLLFLVIGRSNAFSQDIVTNQQILEKLNSMYVKITRLEEGQKSLRKQINDLREEMRGGQQSLQSQINGLQGSDKWFAKYDSRGPCGNICFNWLCSLG